MQNIVRTYCGSIETTYFSPLWSFKCRSSYLQGAGRLKGKAQASNTLIPPPPPGSSRGNLNPKSKTNGKARKKGTGNRGLCADCPRVTT